MKSKPHIPTFSAENAMPPNYAHDLAERVILRHGPAQPNGIPKKRTFSFISASVSVFGAAAAIGLLVWTFHLWNVSRVHSPTTDAIPKPLLEAYLWNEEHVTEADLLLILTGEEADETLNYGLESDPFFF
jgi:hypothetical protein